MPAGGALRAHQAGSCVPSTDKSVRSSERMNRETRTLGKVGDLKLVRNKAGVCRCIAALETSLFQTVFLLFCFFAVIENFSWFYLFKRFECHPLKWRKSAVKNSLAEVWRRLNFGRAALPCSALGLRSAEHPDKAKSAAINAIWSKKMMVF